MAEKRDYYVVLGLSQDVQASDIKKKYRKLALQYHPDRNQNDPTAENKFKEVAEAYEVLSNPEKRAAYDKYGHQDRGTSSNWDIRNPFDIFNIFFRDASPRKGKNIGIDINITLEDVSTGVTKTVNYTRKDICLDCNGIGGAGKSCKACSGYGKIEHRQGPFSQIVMCVKCGGQGIFIKTRCKKCKGTGKIFENRTISVHIPPGIPENACLRVRGEGEKSHKSLARGDLICNICVLEHKIFARRNADLLARVEISFVQAALGGKIEVPGIDSKDILLKIPPGTQFGQTFRIKGKGLPYNQNMGMRGDELIIIHIPVPTNLSVESKRALQRLAKKLKE